MTNFEIFRMREKQVPVDVVEMKGNAKYFLIFEFEPFCIDACVFLRNSCQHVT